MDISEVKLLKKIKKYEKVVFVSIFSIIIYIIAGIFNDAFLEMMSVANYLAWHNIFELASILVSFSVFTITYFAYEETRRLRYIVYGCTFLIMGSLDAFHTLTYKGMPDFFIANDTANRATTLWILSRLIGSLGFMTAISISSNVVSNIKKEILAGVTAIFAITLFLIVTYYPNFFPPMFIEGEGLTSIKIFLEYFIILILLISFVILSAQYRETGSKNIYLAMVALVLLIFSEFAFTHYGSVYDAFNYIGHLYKIIAFSIFYKAIYMENIRRPYRELKKTKDELKNYSDNLNIIVQDRTKKLEELNGVLLNDIKYAKEIQRGLLPYQMPKNMLVSFDAEYLAAGNLSGDFYNVLKLDEDNIAIYIGDVSGHGVSAAMLTVFAYQNIAQLKEKEEYYGKIIEPGYVLKTIYRSFNDTNINDEKYIVMLYGIYNIKDKTFKYASAGINVPPYIIKKTGELYEINVKGFPICKLGDLISPYYDNRMIQLEAGDKMIFYSDGLVEARNEIGEIYGHSKLKDVLRNNHSLNSVDLNTAIKNDFYNHIGHEGELKDDVTFLTMLVAD